MKLYSLFILIFTSLLTLSSVTANAQKKKEESSDDKMKSGTFSGLKFRCIGPALMSGRITDFAVNPENRSEYYVTVASGGVWKTTNSGTTWTPVFDSQGSYSIGCISMDPNNHSVIWVGTGENNSQRSVSFGDGVYRSDDGGSTWKNTGLKNSEHIGKILIDPRNSGVVYVAAQGPLWGPGGDRGLYKTTDRGKTWEQVLFISENTGVTDIVLDPEDPDVIYAASYQRRRHVWTLINGGPESAIYKSEDGGASWDTLKTGLPSGDVGRIGLAISPADRNVLYAVIEASGKGSGVYRSDNRGASWKKQCDYISTSPQYYNEIYADPEDVDRIYIMDTYTQVSDDGGKTLKRLNVKNRHVDDHAFYVDPENTDYYLIGGDGGIYESFDRAKTWHYKSNLPITQFYRVAVDNAAPFYYVYGGTQDNNTIGGPSRTTSVNGIVNSDWFITNGGDGFESAIDPENPDIVYSQSQYGWLVRYDKKSGEKISIKPQEKKGEEAYRWNWDSPLIISPHSHTRLYFAANILFHSDDRGNTWTAVSEDLTRQIDRNKLPVMGKVWSVDAISKNASTSIYGNIVSLAESPLKEGLIYAGTDDGLINVTEDGGKTWRRIESFPAVPGTTYVSCITPSQHDVNTVYASFDNHKMADFKPYILKSTDAGKTWSSIAGNLPEKEIVYSIAQDHKKPGLLFIGTEFGVFFTIDEGKKWIKMKSGLPTICVKDIDIQRRENDVVLGTFGRSFYVLDDYTPLRDIKPELLEKESHIFPVKDALMYIQSRPLGGSDKASQGDSYYTAENPPVGATFTYYFKESIKTQKQLRQEKEKELIKEGKPVPYPPFEELRAEDEEEDPYLIFTIADENGNVIRRLNAPAKKGISRITWDFRYPSTSPARLDSKQENESGLLAMPGKYTVSMAKCVNGVITDLGEKQDFKAVVLNNTSLPAQDRKAMVEFCKEVHELSRAVNGAVRVTNEIGERIKLLKKALKNTPDAPVSLLSDINTIEDKLSEIKRQLTGDRTILSRNENAPVSVRSRVGTIAYGLWNSTSAPTQTQKDSYKVAGEEFSLILSELKQLAETDLVNLEKAMEQAGAPWTPGRIPEWKK